MLTLMWLWLVYLCLEVQETHTQLLWHLVSKHMEKFNFIEVLLEAYTLGLKGARCVQYYDEEPLLCVRQKCRSEASSKSITETSWKEKSHVQDNRKDKPVLTGDGRKMKEKTHWRSNSDYGWDSELLTKMKLGKRKFHLSFMLKTDPIKALLYFTNKNESCLVTKSLCYVRNSLTCQLIHSFICSFVHFLILHIFLSTYRLKDTAVFSVWSVIDIVERLAKVHHAHNSHLWACYFRWE